MQNTWYHPKKFHPCYNYLVCVTHSTIDLIYSYIIFIICIYIYTHRYPA
jgi:hypothetical protein